MSLYAAYYGSSPQPYGFCLRTVSRVSLLFFMINEPTLFNIKKLLVNLFIKVGASQLKQLGWPVLVSFSLFIILGAWSLLFLETNAIKFDAGGPPHGGQPTWVFPRARMDPLWWTGCFWRRSSQSCRASWVVQFQPLLNLDLDDLDGWPGGSPPKSFFGIPLFPRSDDRGNISKSNQKTAFGK